ncbi:MAG: hypothetical protein ACLGSD_07810 [Acidobacteriota bacterium]
MQISLANSGLPSGLRLLRLAALSSSVALAATLLPAQAQPHPKPQPAPKTASAHAGHAKAAKAHREKTPEVAAATPEPPPAPPKPNWPADQPATPATVTWDSHGLEIKAANSSLNDILSQVGTDTGAKITGLTHDERVFGVYGPAPAREVLSELLHGTSYNVIMLGDQGEGTPRQVILSASAPPGPQTQPQNPPPPQENDEVEQPQPAAPNSQPMIPGNQPQFMSPQQRWQQMQEQRQRQLQQQIEQQQGPPPQ